MSFIYIIKNSIGKLYIGITQDPKNRLNYHNHKRGAKFTKYRPDFQIVLLEKYDSTAEARKREIQLKKWSRNKKEELIAKYARGEETRL